jgi:hypothetical protein
MANAATITYDSTTNNYLGPLFVIGANQTPFLTMMGGMRGYKAAPGFEYSMEQYATLEAASQAVFGEDDAVAGTTAYTYDRAQATNSAQIMLRKINVSYAKAAERAKLSGLSFSTPQEFTQSELDFQTEMALKQLSVDLEYSCLQGVYATKASTSTHSATRGICTAIEADGTTAVDAGAGTVKVTKAMMDSVSKKMADAGAPMTSPVIFAGSFQMQQLSDLYSWSPVSGSGAGLGGVRVNRIMTQFFEADVVFAPHMPTDAILIADMDKCSLRGVEVPGKGAIMMEPLGKVGASDAFQIVAHLGMDYADPKFHGLIYDLAVA